MVACAPSEIRLIRTSGVLPISAVTSLAMCMVPSLPVRAQRAMGSSVQSVVREEFLRDIPAGVLEVLGDDEGVRSRDKDQAHTFGHRRQELRADLFLAVVGQHDI